jgi:hypothetical protein
LSALETTSNVQVAAHHWRPRFVANGIDVILYALDAKTGATLWCFQTVSDKIGQQLRSTAGGAWMPC